MSSRETDEVPWYEEWFDREEYELVYRDRNKADAARLIDLLEQVVRPASRASILDVACGRGRHARLLAERGYEITGLDLAERALTTARRRAVDEGLDIEFVQADMRTFRFDRSFDGAVNLFTSFGYFEADSDHDRVIRNISHVLKPGGWFVQDFLNVSYAKDTLVPEDERTENGVHIRQQRWISDNRLNKRIVIEKNDEPHVFTESVRLLTLEDFERMYEAAGLTLFEVYGDYEGGPYTSDSPRLLMFSRKTDDAGPREITE